MWACYHSRLYLLALPGCYDVDKDLTYSRGGLNHTVKQLLKSHDSNCFDYKKNCYQWSWLFQNERIWLFLHINWLQCFCLERTSGLCRRHSFHSWPSSFANIDMHLYIHPPVLQYSSHLITVISQSAQTWPVLVCDLSPQLSLQWFAFEWQKSASRELGAHLVHFTSSRRPHNGDRIYNSL